MLVPTYIILRSINHKLHRLESYSLTFRCKCKRSLQKFLKHILHQYYLPRAKCCDHETGHNSIKNKKMKNKRTVLHLFICCLKNFFLCTEKCFKASNNKKQATAKIRLRK